MKLFELFRSSAKKPSASHAPHELIGLTSGEIEAIKTNGANLVDGQQCWEYADTHKDDLEMMLRCCENQLKQNSDKKGPKQIPAPFYFKRVAIIMRKRKDYEGEIAICNRYIEHNRLLEQRRPGYWNTAHYNEKFEYRAGRAKLLKENQLKKNR